MISSDDSTFSIGDIVRAKATRVEVFGIFCVYDGHEILVLIPETSWIPCYNSCRQIAAVGDEMDVKISGWNKEQDEISGSIRAIHPENDPWEGNWSLKAGDVYEGRILRWVENADRCGGAGGYLVEIKPGALVMLCGHNAGEFAVGNKCRVTITLVDDRKRHVAVQLVR